MNQCLSAALEYSEAGLSVIPANPDKRPALRTWAPYQKAIADQGTIKAMFGNGTKYLGTIAGKVSGGLEILDFDCKGEAFDPWCQLVKEGRPDLFERLVLEGSPSGGSHDFYRCLEIAIPGNTKLAFKKIRVPGPGKHEYKGKEHEAIKVNGQWFIKPELIETRGEGGYCIVNPSEGYTLKQGDLRNIPVITAEERDFLIGAARSFNEWVEERDVERGHTPEDQQTRSTAGKLPGRDFDERGDVRALLTAHGWVKTHDAPVERYRRPGKNRGHHATLLDGKIFYCWTSNAPPFEPQKAYSPFAVYAFLEHGGDFKEAAKALKHQGYGDDRAYPKVDAQESMERACIEQVVFRLHDRIELNKAEEKIGERTGFRFIDDSIYGLVKTFLYIIGAYTSVGKTALMVQLIVNCLKYNPKIKIAVFSTEMSAEHIVLRFVANQTAISSLRIYRGRFDHKTRQTILEAFNYFLNKNIWLWDDVYTFRGMYDRCKALDGLDAVFVDFLQNMQGEGGIYERMSILPVELQKMAKGLNTSIVAMSQVSNEAAKGSQGIIGYKGAGEIAAACDFGLWLERSKQDKRNLECFIRKNRHGPTGNAVLRYSDNYTRLEETEG
jgi:hypothetical protein